ncbi:MAG TPA: AI-2E family transporter, partial [Candidatus Paceibacterota bacterium]|nr:AI-2E family transporter [Candidatus Paceibacterota bacterium]
SLRRIGYWFRTQLFLSVIMAGLVYITLTLLGVKYVLIISLLTAVFELVPFIGPIAAGAVAFLSAIVTQPESASLALYTLFAFIALHQLENHVLVPLIVGRNLGLHPVVVIISLLIGLEVAGFLGAIVSVPITVILQEALENWSEKKTRRLSAA